MAVQYYSPGVDTRIPVPIPNFLGWDRFSEFCDWDCDRFLKILGLGPGFFVDPYWSHCQFGINSALDWSKFAPFDQMIQQSSGAGSLGSISGSGKHARIITEIRIQRLFFTNQEYLSTWVRQSGWWVDRQNENFRNFSQCRTMPWDKAP